MLDLEKTYTRKDIHKIVAHIPSRTLRSWVETGLVEWAGETHDGRGLHREFKFWNLFQLGLVEQLNGLNLPHDIIKFILSNNGFIGLVDEKPKIMECTVDILVIFKAGLTRQKEVWKSTLVHNKELPKFFERFSNPANDDVLMHALRFRLDPEPIAIIMVNMAEVYDRVLAHMRFYG
jgi:hypothetical protein